MQLIISLCNNRNAALCGPPNSVVHCSCCKLINSFLVLYSCHCDKLFLKSCFESSFHVLKRTFKFPDKTLTYFHLLASSSEAVHFLLLLLYTSSALKRLNCYTYTLLKKTAYYNLSVTY